MPEINPSDESALQADTAFGKFVPDPNDPLIQRYIPAASELEKLNEWISTELEQAWRDDQPLRMKKLRLLDAYRCVPDGKDQTLILPLVKRAVRRNVSYPKGKILAETPIVTIKPTSNTTTEVLVEHPDYGTVPLKKSSEEVAQATEWWLEWKLRNEVKIAEKMDVAITEAKRGQTPTWLKTIRKKETRIAQSPRFKKQGPIAVTFNSKEDVELSAGPATDIINISTYSMLMPSGWQDHQRCPWLAEDLSDRIGNKELRASLYNGDYFLGPKTKADREEFITDGEETEVSPEEAQKAARERRTPAVPRKYQPVWEFYFRYSVPMKQQSTKLNEETGETTSQTLTTYQEYEMVGHFHRKNRKLMSMMRIPFDHGERPYDPVFDRKEPFRHAGESIAEDVVNYQRVVSQLVALEIKGGVIATTPIFYAEPGSMAGEYLTDNGGEVNPGDVIPRLKPEEIEKDTLGERELSLLGLINWATDEYEKATSIGDLQLGLDVPGRTPASSIAQVLNEGQTEANDFLERFCGTLIDSIVRYVKTVQQYMRTGEVIPFDPETKALVMKALQGDSEQPPDPSEVGDGVPMRFPLAPITDQFMFSMTCLTGENDQADFEKYVAFKQIVDADGMQMAQIIGPLASGQLPPTIVEALVQHFSRSERIMSRLGRSLAKDGDSFAISEQLIRAIPQEMAMIQQQQMEAQMTAQNGVPNGAQGSGPSGQPTGVPDNSGGLGPDVSQPGIPEQSGGDQAGASGLPVGAPV